MTIFHKGQIKTFAINFYHKNMFTIIKPARSVGFWWNKKIPYQAPPTQLGALKMYILDKRILWT